MDVKEEIEKGIKESNLIGNFFVGVQNHWKLSLIIAIVLFLIVWFTPMDDETETYSEEPTTEEVIADEGESVGEQ